MSSAVATPEAAEGDAAAGTRGHTRIDPKVVQKVAAEAVREIDNATGSPRRLLGITLGSTDSDTGAQISAQVDDNTALVEVTMTVVYPASVQQVTRQTREHVRERVKELTGVNVREVDITVAGMRVRETQTPRVQ